MCYRFACVITLNTKFAITGGKDTRKAAYLYDEDGYDHDLPDLNEGRNGHACGHFINKNNKLVSRNKTRLNHQAKTRYYL